MNISNFILNEFIDICEDCTSYVLVLYTSDEILKLSLFDLVILLGILYYCVALN